MNSTIFDWLYKQHLLDSFLDIQNNQSIGKSYQPQHSGSADNPYLDFDYLGQHKNVIQ